MWLLIDAGNTRIKCLVADDPGPKAEVDFASSDYATEMNSWLMDMKGVGRIIVSSVIGKDFEDWLIQQCRGLGLVVPEFPNAAKMNLGVSHAYEDPSQFGVDRYLAMAAAYKLVGGGVLVVDCGTAVTVDAVDEKGRYQGGVIMPGIEMMKHALMQKTKGIGETNAEGIDVFSHSTSAGVASGALLAVVGGIREVLERQSGLMNAETQCLITGGSSGLVAENLGLPCRVCHNLVFDGLKMFAKQ
jgi:type III pantothenate kinase